MNSLSVMYSTDKMYLTPFTSEVAYSSNYQHWFNLQEVTRFSQHGCFPMTTEKIDDFIKNVGNSDTNLVLSIIETQKNIHVGNLSLQGIDWQSRSAELAIILGEKEYWRQGIGFDACQAIVGHGFNRLNLNRIWLGCSVANVGMIHIACKLGMACEGGLKQAVFHDGEYQDVIRYGILKENWKNE